MKKDTYTITARVNGQRISTLVKRGDSIASFRPQGADFLHGGKTYSYGPRTEQGTRLPLRSGFADGLLDFIRFK